MRPLFCGSDKQSRAFKTAGAIHQMTPKNLRFMLALFLSGLFFAPTSNAGLLGKTLTIAYYSGTTAISGTSVQVTGGTSVELSGWPSGSFPLTGLRLNVDVTDTSIIFSNTQEVILSFFTPATPSIYLVIKDATNNLPDFSSNPTDTFLAHTITGLDSSDLNVTSDRISLLLNGASMPTKTPDGYITLQIGFANTTPPVNVPAPAPLVLIITGLLLSHVSKKNVFARQGKRPA